MGAQRAVHVEEALDLVQHVVEAAGLVAVGASNVLPCIGSQIQATVAPAVTASTSGGSALADPSRAHPDDQGEPSRLAVRVEPRSGEHVVGRWGRAQLDPIGLRIRRANSTWAPPGPGPLADPEEVRGQVVGLPVRASVRVRACS